MNTDNIPADLRTYDNWLVWKKEARKKGEGFTKIPYAPLTGARAKRLADRTTFDNALKALQGGGYDGIGFHFSKSPLVGIDIDHCIKNGVLDDRIRAIIKPFNTYTEISPSGTGLHIIGRANIAIAVNRAVYDLDKSIHFEMYSEKRYFTITGDIFEGRSVVSDINESAAAFQKYLQGLKGAGAEKDNHKETPLTVQEIITAYEHSPKKGFVFNTLFVNGDFSDYPSQSEADLALMNDLCFFCNGDRDLIRAVFMESALANTLNRKGSPDQYLQRTIETALKKWNGEGYNPNYHDKTAPSGPPRINFPVVNSKGLPRRKHIKNVEAVLDFMGVTVRNNLLTKELEITYTNTGENVAKDVERAILDINGVCDCYGLSLSTNQLREFISGIASENTYNPVCVYLTDNYNAYKDVLDLESGENIEALFSCLQIKGGDEAVALCRVLFVKWLVNAYRIAFNDGTTNCEGVLVLQGRQGIGKTRFLYTLSPCGNWVKEGIQIRKGDRDEINTATRYWLVELGEIGATVKRSQLDFLKNFITSNDDEYRLPYARKSSRFPRLTAFLGTVNQADYLKDDTGDRRYWTIPVLSIEGTEEININAVWAEVAYLVNEKHMPHYLTANEKMLLNKSNEQFQNRTSEEITLLDRLEWDSDISKWAWVHLSDLCTLLSISNSRIRLLGRAVTRIAMQDKRIRKNTNHHTNARYFLPPLRDDDFEI